MHVQALLIFQSLLGNIPRKIKTKVSHVYGPWLIAQIS